MKTFLSGLSCRYITNLKNRVRSKMKIGPDCWLWTGGTHDPPDNYGYLYVMGRYTGAHRAAYAVLVDDFDASLHVLHNCDNPMCVRPNHLFLGTNLDNQADRATKLRGRRKLNASTVLSILSFNQAGMTQYEIAESVGIGQSSVRDVLTGETYKSFKKESAYKVQKSRGEKNTNSKLTDSKVRVIRRMLSNGVPCSRIAARFGVWPSTIAFVRDGKTWRHVS